MPELPDVAHFKKYLDATSLHQPIRRIEIRDAEVVEGVSPRRLRRTLEDRSFSNTDRWGKFLFVALNSREADERSWLVMHFGMTGYLDYTEGSHEPPDHSRVIYHFESGSQLAYVCQRKLGLVTLAGDVMSFASSRDLGPDGLDDQLGLDDFRQRLADRRGSVKSALMNQEIVAGIGNVYSDEILFHAHLHPKRSVNELDDAEIRGLYRALRKVLGKAVDCNADVQQLPRTYLLPHRDDDGRCPRCDEQLKQVKVSGRTAFFCPNCQQ